jgi:putative oxidoreductase
MSNLKNIGRIIYSVIFIVFGVMHFMMAGDMSGMVPSWVPGGVFWVYITGLALIAAGVSLIIQKHHYLAAVLLAALLFSFVLTIHLPAILGGNMMSMSQLLKDAGLAGAALYMAGGFCSSEG